MTVLFWTGIALESLAVLVYVVTQVVVRVRHDRLFTLSELEVEAQNEREGACRAVQLTGREYAERLAVAAMIFVVLTVIGLSFTITLR